MGAQYKNSCKIYSAWNYEKEVEDLNKASEQGWQLVRGGCFHSRFVKNPGIQYRYQVDFRRIEDMGRYIETFREQGWEYINSTFNGWHYFRKLYDPTLPEEAYEIFTDRESLHEMNNRWARIALGIGIALALFAVLYCIKLIRQPNLPSLIQVLTFAIESVVLLRGWSIMRKPGSNRSRRGDSLFITVFFIVILLGASVSIVLSDLRPNLYTEQNSASIDQPIVDEQWLEFKIHYPDRYYLDVDIEASEPATIKVVDASGAVVYEVTETSFHKQDLPVKLSRGTYKLSLSCTSGFDVKCKVQ